MAKELVRQGSINVVLLAERPFADSWKLNRFVLESAFEYKPFLQDTAFNELALWLREYNQGKPEKDKVYLMGGDVAYPHEAAMNALEFCHKNGIELPTATIQVLKVMSGLAADLVGQYGRIRWTRLWPVSSRCSSG